ncbi:MAG: hypothetical protein RKE49_08245 [Oceanicaulis sp.]
MKQFKVLSLIVLAGFFCCPADADARVGWFEPYPQCAAPGALSLKPATGAPLIVMLGELHGSREAPAFVGSLACTYARAGLRTAVLLEIPADVNADLRGLSGDRALDRQRLCRGRIGHFWSWTRDGRGTTATAELMLDVAAMRAADAPLTVAGFDASDIPVGLDGEEIREVRYGVTLDIVRQAAQTHDVTLMLIGNLHPPGLARRIADIPELKAARIVRLRQRYEAGEAWNCAPSCGVNVFDGHGRDPGEPIFSIELNARYERFDGTVHTGPITPAYPVRDSSFCAAEQP